MTTPDEYLQSLPPITRVYLISVLLTTLLTALSIIPAYYLYFDITLIVYKFHIWRLLTSFFYLGPLGLPWIFGMYMLFHYMRELETNHYTPGVRALSNFTYLILFAVVSFFLISILLTPLPFMAASLTMYFIHIWARKDPMQVVNFYGFTFSRWHVPFLMLALSMVMGGGMSPASLVGLAIGHLWVFLDDIIPKYYGKHLVYTPDWISGIYQRYLPNFAMGDSASRGGAMARPGNVQPPPPMARPNWQSGQGHRLDQ